MAYLHERHGVRSVLCEGGPTLNSFLFAATWSTSCSSR